MYGKGWEDSPGPFQITAKKFPLFLLFHATRETDSTLRNGGNHRQGGAGIVQLTA